MTLFIERSTDVQSLALAGADGLVRETVLEGAGPRSGDWAVRVREFIADASVERIVAGTGPGSFAGIRAALAFAQGYAIGSGCEVLGLPSACALAEPGADVAAVGDARRGMLWVALFRGLAPEGEIFQTAEDAIASAVPDGFSVVTPDAARIGAKLEAAFGGRYRGGRVPLASALAASVAAIPSLARPEPLPVYLNPAVRK